MSLASRLIHRAGDTTWVGYSPTFAGSNYWSVGTGANRGLSTAAGDHGYWTGCSGPWRFTSGLVAVRQLYTVRWSDPLGRRSSWWAIDYGNQVNYVINQVRASSVPSA